VCGVRTPFLFANVFDIAVHDIIEVTGAFSRHKGREGIVIHIEGDTATVQPVDTNNFEATGHCFKINAGLLTRQPTQTDIRREKVKLREKHLAELKPPTSLPLPKIRTFTVVRSRNKRADYQECLCPTPTATPGGF
jgi:hypothetical protein